MEDLKKSLVNHWETIKQKWKSLTITQKYGVGVVGFILLFVVIALGINIAANGGFGSQVDVQVYSSENNEPVENAEVNLGDSFAVTDSQGIARFTGIRNTLYEVNIFHPNYSDFQNTITINNSNKDSIIFFLEESGSATIEGSVVATNGILNNESIEVKAGEVVSSVDEDGIFVLENVPISTTELVVHSPDYVDVTKKLQLSSGVTNIDVIELVAGYDYFVTIVDFLTSSPVEGARVDYLDTTYTSDTEGLLEIRDIPLDSEVDLQITKQGYVSSPLTISPRSIDDESRTTLIDQVTLTKEGKVLYTSERDGSSDVYAANYDGTDEIKINETGDSSVGAARNPAFSGNEVLFFSITADANAPRVFKATEVGQTPVLVSASDVTASNDESIIQEFYFLESQKKVRYTRTVEDEQTKLDLELRNLNDSGVQKIYTTSFDNEERVVELRSVLVSDSGNFVTFVRSENKKTTFEHIKSDVIEYDIQASTSTVIKSVTKESSSLTLVDVAPNNEYIATSDLSASGQRLVTIINTGSDIQVDYDSLNMFQSFAQISYDSKYLYFLSERDGKSDVYRLEFQSGEVEQVTQMQNVGSFFVDRNNVLLYQVELDMFLIDFSQGTPSDPVSTSISSNFTMWNSLLSL